MNPWAVLRVIGSLIDVIDEWLTNSDYKRPAAGGRRLGNTELFRKEIYEIAFGKHAIEEGYTDRNVVNRLKELKEELDDLSS